MTYQDVYLMDNLTIEAKAIYGMLCSYAGTGGTAYPSVEFICNSLQISERRFYTHMNLLVGAGIVEKQICRKNGKRSNNLYVLTPNIHFQPVENESVENVGSNNNTINNNNTNNNINTICSELQEKKGTGIKIPLVDGTYFDVPEDKIPLWQQAYPSVNIDQELKKIIAWCDANPTKRKTRRGVTKFINSWLDRSQNQGRGTNGQQIGVRSGENKQGYIDSYI